MTQDLLKYNSASEITVTSEKMERIVKEFTLTNRYWPSYSVDKLEAMARHSGVIPKDALYVTFDPVREVIIFRVPGYVLDDPYTRMPWWKRWLHRWRVRKLVDNFYKENH